MGTYKLIIHSEKNGVFTVPLYVESIDNYFETSIIDDRIYNDNKYSFTLCNSNFAHQK